MAYMDLGQFKETRNGKKYFVKLGYAKEDGNGGFYCNFDALPLPDDQGRVSVRMMPQRDRSDSQQQEHSNSEPPNSGGSGAGIDDDIQFGPEVR